MIPSDLFTFSSKIINNNYDMYGKEVNFLEIKEQIFLTINVFSHLLTKLINFSDY